MGTATSRTSGRRQPLERLVAVRHSRVIQKETGAASLPQLRTVRQTSRWPRRRSHRAATVLRMEPLETTDRIAVEACPITTMAGLSASRMAALVKLHQVTNRVDRGPRRLEHAKHRPFCRFVRFCGARVAAGRLGCTVNEPRSWRFGLVRRNLAPGQRTRHRTGGIATDGGSGRDYRISTRRSLGRDGDGPTSRSARKHCPRSSRTAVVSRSCAARQIRGRGLQQAGSRAADGRNQPPIPGAGRNGGTWKSAESLDFIGLNTTRAGSPSTGAAPHVPAWSAGHRSRMGDLSGGWKRRRCDWRARPAGDRDEPDLADAAGRVPAAALVADWCISDGPSSVRSRSPDTSLAMMETSMGRRCRLARPISRGFRRDGAPPASPRSAQVYSRIARETRSARPSGQTNQRDEVRDAPPPDLPRSVPSERAAGDRRGVRAPTTRAGSLEQGFGSYDYGLAAPCPPFV